MPPLGYKLDPNRVRDPSKPALKKRGPKPKAPSAAKPARITPVLKNSVFRSREKKLAVLTWIVQTRYPCQPLHPGRAGLVTEFGWRAPTDQEASDFFKIPATTINSWWRNRDVIMNQPKGSRIVRQSKKKEDDTQAEREASNGSELTTPGQESAEVDSPSAIDLTEDTPTPEAPAPAPAPAPAAEAPGSPPPPLLPPAVPTFLSTLNTVVSFHSEAPPSRKRAKPKPKPKPQTEPLPSPQSLPQPTLVGQAPLPVHAAIAVPAAAPQPKAPAPRNAPREFRAHFNALTAPPPRQPKPAEQPPPQHHLQGVRVVYPEPPPSARVETMHLEMPLPRGLEIPPPVVPQYPSFPIF